MGKLSKNRRIQLFFLFLILILASFLRLYRIADYLVFLGDEGRDVLVVKRMIVDHKFTLLGPTASIAPFHLGPFYYYLMLPFLWIFNLDPVGPAVMVALFGIATVFLIYWVGKDFFNEKIGLLAASLYAISPLVIIHSRSSWNPNVLPFFSLLLIFFLKKAVEKKYWLYYLGVGVLFGFAIQLHYLALFLIPVILTFLLIFSPLKNNFKFYLLVFWGFLIGWSPFLLFEFRHQFVNLKNLYWFLSSGEKTGWDFYNFFAVIKKVIIDLFTLLLAGGNVFWGKIFSLLPIPFAYLCWRERKNQKIFRNYLLLGIWLFWGVILFGFFKGAIYGYYFTFIFALPFLLAGLTLERMMAFNKILCYIAILLYCYIIFLNIQKVHFRYSPNRQLEQTKNVAHFIIDKTEEKPFNLALISNSNTDFAYRYFLEIWEKAPVIIEPPQVDPERKTVTNQLFVICEDKECQPLGHPLWEIAGFGIAEVKQEWEVYGVKVYKLVHRDSQNEKSNK
jgi:4-amino-4-deoxy-L-arabinose transferase-like glycosyltransferase